MNKDILNLKTLLYSPKSKQFHRENLEATIRDGIEVSLGKTHPGYFLVGVSPNDKDLDEIRDFLKHSDECEGGFQKIINGIIGHKDTDDSEEEICALCDGLEQVEVVVANTGKTEIHPCPVCLGNEMRRELEKAQQQRDMLAQALRAIASDDDHAECCECPEVQGFDGIPECCGKPFRGFDRAQSLAAKALRELEGGDQ